MLQLLSTQQMNPPVSIQEEALPLVTFVYLALMLRMSGSVLLLPVCAFLGMEIVTFTLPL
jgi:hypothetical protein